MPKLPGVFGFRGPRGPKRTVITPAQVVDARGGVYTHWDRIESFPTFKQVQPSQTALALFVKPAPFVQTDWPVPKAAQRIQATYTQTNAFMVEPKIELLTMGRSFTQPAPPAPVVQSWGQNLLETTLTPDSGLPFGYISWTAPQAPLQFVTGRAVSFGPDKLANGAVGGVYTNWDRIENRPIPQQAQPFVNMLPLTVAPQAPFVQTDWPLPTRAVQIAQNGNAGLNLPLNDFIPVFPNTIGIPDATPYPLSLRTWSQTSAFIPVAVANQVGVFFTSWGIPDAPFYSVPRGWAQNLLETTLSVVTPPDPTIPQRDGDGVKRRGVKPLPFIRPKVERDLDDVLEIVSEASETRRPSDNRKTIKAAIAKLQEVTPPPDYAAPIAAIGQALRNVSRATAKHQGMQEAVARIVAELDAVIMAMETERKAAEAEREVKAQARRYRDTRDLEALAWLLS